MARMMMLTTLCALVLLSSFCEPAHAKGFLARQDQVEDLLKSVEGLLGSELRHFAQKRLGSIENRLRPIYIAMNKNMHGKLGHAAASYALHRLFVQRHGWHITGLEPEGKGFKAWSTSSPTSVLQKHLPEDMLIDLKARLFENGFGLHELAIVAAAIEHFIHEEDMERLLVAFQAQHASTGRLLKIGEADRILDFYMMLYIIGFAFEATSGKPNPQILPKFLRKMPLMYPNWHLTQEFVREVRHSVVPKTNNLSFDDVVTVVAETGERYGSWQGAECRSIKAQLVALEDTGAGGAGRVRLADFYSVGLRDKHFQFTESRSLLRKLGALDETDSTSLK